MYQPSIDEVLFGAMKSQTPNTYYATEMRYPVRGGYRAFFEHITVDLDIKLEHRVIAIDIDNKLVSFENGKQVTYENLISKYTITYNYLFFKGQSYRRKTSS